MKSGQMHGVGTVLGGRYLLEEVRGIGGMGTVYTATHLTLDSPVAVKVLHAQFSRDEAYRRRFEREARVLSRLRHPSAVQVHDFGIHEGLLYIVMELISGASLREVIARRGVGSLPYGQVVHIATALAEVLVAAHGLQLVHRDLKPENILLESLPGGKERVIVVDFGMAFVVGSGELGRMTETGVVVGTPLYVSPEQAEGMAVGPPADIYSLGCILYELCTGRPPFLGKSSVHILNSHLFVAPTPPQVVAPGLTAPPAFLELIMSMLQKPPEHRPTAAEVCEVLRHCAPPEAPSAAPQEEALASSGGGWPSGLYEEATQTMRSAARPELTDSWPEQGDPTEVLSFSAPRVARRVGFLDIPIGGELIRSFGARGLSCHLYSAEERFDAVIVLNPSPATLHLLGTASREVFALLEPLEGARVQALRAAGATGVYTSHLSAGELADEVASALERAVCSAP